MLYWHVALDADGAFVLAGLIDDARRKGDQLGEIAAVEFEFLNLLAGDGAADFGGLRVHLGDVFTGDDHFFGDGADREGDVHAGFLGYFQNDIPGFEFLKTFGTDNDGVFPGREGGGDVDTITVGLRVARQVSPGAGDDHFCADDGGAGFVGDRAADQAVGLRGEQGG